MRWLHRTDPDARARAEEARHRAEEALAAERRQLEAVKAETPRYAALGRSLLGMRERNHISEHLIALYTGRKL